MLRVRHIEEGEIPSFIEAYADPAARARIGRFFADSETKPSLCFVTEKNDARRAAVVYFRIDSDSDELFVTDIDLPWNGDYLVLGKQLLEESAAAVAAEEFTRLELRLSDSYPHLEKLINTCKGAGYILAQHKTRYVLERFAESHNTNSCPYRLHYKSRAEIGDEKFITAIKRVTEGTLDCADLLDRQRLGADEAARRYFETLASIDDEPRRWLLAYDTEGKLIGLIVCQLLSATTGCINYIGVVPECRGKGYSRDLIGKASEVFGNIPGIEKIVADIDSDNLPLAKNLILSHYSSLNFLALQTIVWERAEDPGRLDGIELHS